MFCFTLAPLKDVPPWRDASGPFLHWFALSWGTYYVDAGSHRLLEYASDRFGRVVEYQVAQFHSDLLEMLPAVLCPLPEPLVDRLPNGSLLAARSVLLSGAEALPLEQPLWDALDGIRQRRLDTLYLSPGADIALWRRTGSIVLEWDNRGLLFERSPAWSASIGNVTLPLDEFVANVAAFHHSFLKAMQQRIEEAVALKALGIRIDAEQLAREQQRRAGLLDLALVPADDHDLWDEAVRALAALLEGAG